MGNTLKTGEQVNLTENAWIEAGVRVILRKAINKGLRWDDRRTLSLFTALSTEFLVDFARSSFPGDAEREAASWAIAAGKKRLKALDCTIGEADRVYGKALAEADLMVKQSSAVFDLLAGRAQ